MSGFIALHREAFSHPVLKDADRFRAWFWLVAHAAWKQTRHDARGRTIIVERGQLCAGREQLAKEWKWSPSAVERFLARLETEQMIERQTGQGKSVITICNYDKYQDRAEETGQMSGQQTGQKPDRNRTAKEQGNKGTSDEEAKASPSQRARKAHRLPIDWSPKPLPADLAAIVAGWPDGAIAAEEAKFRDWAKAAPDKAGLKNDWDAAWRNWLRRAADEGRYRNDRPSPRLQPANDFRNVRGSRPNPALDMVLQAERELQAEAFRQNPGPDWEAWPALPSGQPS